MKEIKDAVGRVIAERLNSRFFGTFVLSWLLYNWKILAILFFSATNITDRIENVEAAANVGTFLAPVGIAFVYLMASPWISNGVDFIQARAVEYRKQRMARDRLADLDREAAIEQRRSDIQASRNISEAMKELERRVSEELDASLSSRSEEIVEAFRTYYEKIESFEARLESVDTKTEYAIQIIEPYLRRLNAVDCRLDDLFGKVVDIEGQNPPARVPDQESSSSPHVNNDGEQIQESGHESMELTSTNSPWKNAPEWDKIISSLQQPDPVPRFRYGIDEAKALAESGIFPSRVQFWQYRKLTDKVRENFNGRLAPYDAILNDVVSRLAEVITDEKQIIDDLGLSQHTVRCLKAHGIDTVHDLADVTSRDLLAIDGIEPESVKEIDILLSRFGHSLEIV